MSALIQGTVDTVDAFLPSRDNGHIQASPHAEGIYREEGHRINEYPRSKPYSVALEDVPVTIERMPYFQNAKEEPGKPTKHLIDAGTARVNIAASHEKPHGTTEDNWFEEHKHQTVVQQHCSYWDPDGDNVIWPLDVYRGCHAWGWNPLLSLLAMVIISGNLSYPTGPSFLPDPFFRIHITRVHKCKHGSDSMTYDPEGRFRPQMFEDMFAKYDSDNKGGLNLYDLARFLKGQRMALDLFGMSAAFLEWLAVYLLLWPEDGILRKEEVRRVFDGSIFQKKADEYQAKKRRRNVPTQALKNA